MMRRSSIPRYRRNPSGSANDTRRIRSATNGNAIGCDGGPHSGSRLRTHERANSSFANGLRLKQPRSPAN